MDDAQFEASRAEGGIHHWLSRLEGSWQGTTRTWFEPGKLADESRTQGTFRLVLNGRFLLHEYSGSLMGQGCEGVALFGYNLNQERYAMSWVDNCHMGSGMMFSESSGTQPPFSVLGHYPAPEGPPWGWRTTLELDGDDRLILTHYNITPNGQEAKAVETNYTRVTEAD